MAMSSIPAQQHTTKSALFAPIATALLQGHEPLHYITMNVRNGIATSSRPPVSLMQSSYP